jgi:hypothetical protein
VVPEDGGFADMVKLKGDKEIGDKINKITAGSPRPTNSKGSSIRPTSTTRTSLAACRYVYEISHGIVSNSSRMPSS